MKAVCLRFSAMGDVILTVSVVQSMLKQNPDLEIHFFSRVRFKTFFAHIERCEFHAVDFDGVDKGLLGLFSLAGDILKLKPRYVFDLHDVLRTKALGFMLIFTSIKVFKIQKNRRQKKLLLSGQIKESLPHAKVIYMNCFKQSDLHCSDDALPCLRDPKEPTNKVGIAPFAAHDTKVWPIKNYIQILERFPHIQFYFFGAGKQEYTAVNELIEGFGNATNVINTMELSQEMEFIKSLDFMIAMDSSNMHLANLVGVPCISIWGSTHTMAGFGPVDPKDFVLEIPRADLPCRPCSIYGQKPCHRGDHACMEGISVQMVVLKMEELFSSL